jgi:hypothetical protein
LALATEPAGLTDPQQVLFPLQSRSIRVSASNSCMFDLYGGHRVEGWSKFGNNKMVIVCKNLSDNQTEQGISSRARNVLNQHEMFTVSIDRHGWFQTVPREVNAMLVSTQITGKSFCLCLDRRSVNVIALEAVSKSHH